MGILNFFKEKEEVALKRDNEWLRDQVLSLKGQVRDLIDSDMAADSKLAKAIQNQKMQHLSTEIEMRDRHSTEVADLKLDLSRVSSELKFLKDSSEENEELKEEVVELEATISELRDEIQGWELDSERKLTKAIDEATKKLTVDNAKEMASLKELNESIKEELEEVTADYYDVQGKYDGLMVAYKASEKTVETLRTMLLKLTPEMKISHTTPNTIINNG